MLQCNECVVKSCRRMKNKNNLSMYELRSECTNFLPPIPFKLPVLMHLLSDNKKVSNTHKVLESFGFKVEEQGTKPYFKLRLR